MSHVHGKPAGRTQRVMSPVQWLFTVIWISLIIYMLLLGSITWNVLKDSKVLSRNFSDPEVVLDINNIQDQNSLSTFPELLSQKQHVLENMHRCLDTINLTNYFIATGHTDAARRSSTNILRIIRRFVPDVFVEKSRNHCWNMNISTRFTDTFIGQIGSEQFTITDTKILSTNLLHRAQKFFPGFSSSSVCLPEIFLAGFPKCGSTLLYNLLISHPSITEPVFKEPHWWVNTRSFSDQSTVQLAAYLHNFAPLIMQSDPATYLTVDATPSIMFGFPGFDLKMIFNVCLLPALIPEILPKSKFIVVMRDPVDMMYSAFWHSCTRNGGSVPMEIQLKGPDIFHERVVSKVHSFNSCIKRFPLLKCVMDALANAGVSKKELPNCGRTRVDVAIYYIHVKKWLSVVPRERFLFLTVEELFSSPDVVMGRIWKFLDIPLFQGYQSVLSDPRIVHQQDVIDYHHNPRLQMRNDTREILQQFFHPFNQKLADLLGDEKFLW